MDCTKYDPMEAEKSFAPDRWQRTPLCGPDKGDCVEINVDRPGLVAIRDSKLADSPVLVFSTAEWETFARALAGGTFHRG
ncbi:protein of unknown function [Amycolatopsis pretoriensis]|uniref:DUF397 domain-containing protein n=1 Tax=Amycolatopsis pretoriensis TaxID=218821 RepID=A0A1H5RGT7_9PSEU|nr:DUF397 domain-containing protein [Amycolatopsis pretoriensis]SEF36928.1 protein of unknown function [Amycolatopsis pretoriensis]